MYIYIYRIPMSIFSNILEYLKKTPRSRESGNCREEEGAPLHPFVNHQFPYPPGNSHRPWHQGLEDWLSLFLFFSCFFYFQGLCQSEVILGMPHFETNVCPEPPSTHWNIWNPPELECPSHCQWFLQGQTFTMFQVSTAVSIIRYLWPVAYNQRIWDPRKLG